MQHIRWSNRRETMYIKNRPTPTSSIKPGLNLFINYMPKEVPSSPNFHRKNKPLSFPLINILIPKFIPLYTKDIDNLENITYIPDYCNKE